MSNLTTTLLITHNAELVNQVQALHDACSNSRLEICGRIDKACQVGQQHAFTLVLVHVASARRGMDAETMRRSFHLENCTIVPIVLADEIVSPASLADCWSSDPTVQGSRGGGCRDRASCELPLVSCTNMGHTLFRTIRRIRYASNLVNTDQSTLGHQLRHSWNHCRPGPFDLL